MANLNNAGVAVNYSDSQGRLVFYDASQASMSIANWFTCFPGLLKLDGDALHKASGDCLKLFTANPSGYVQLIFGSPKVQPAENGLTYSQLRTWGQVYMCSWFLPYGNDMQDWGVICVPPDAPLLPVGYPSYLPYPVFAFTSRGWEIKLYRIRRNNFIPTIKDLAFMMIVLNDWVVYFNPGGKFHDYSGKVFDVFSYDSAGDGSGFTIPYMLYSYCLNYRRETDFKVVAGSVNAWTGEPVPGSVYPATFDHLYGQDYTLPWGIDKIGVPWSGANYRDSAGRYGHWKFGVIGEGEFLGGSYDAGILQGLKNTTANEYIMLETLNFTEPFAWSVPGWVKSLEIAVKISAAIVAAVAALVPVVGAVISGVIVRSINKESLIDQLKLQQQVKMNVGVGSVVNDEVNQINHPGLLGEISNFFSSMGSKLIIGIAFICVGGYLLLTGRRKR